MAKKDRFPHGCFTGFAPHYESEGSGSSGRIDTEITASEVSSGPSRKCVVFGAHKQVHLLSKLSLPERKDLILRLRTELEQVQNLQKKIEFQRTNVVAHSSSSDPVSFSDAQKKPSALTHGPGEILNPSSSQKGRGWNRDNSGRFEAQNAAPLTTLNAVLFKQCENLLKKLMSHPYGWVFNTPVDVVKLNLPDYLTVIKHPMDLGTIKRKIMDLEYSNPIEFHADVKVTFSNAMTYNPPGNDVHIMADTLNKFFDTRWKVIEKKLNANKSKPLPEESKEMVVKPMPPTKKRKITSIENKTKPEPVGQKMTVEEKQDLGRDLEALLGDLPDKIVDFLKQQSSNGKESGEDEIEIDIDDLSEDTLLTLRKLVDEHLQDKQNLAKAAEPCEIECYSNSVLQLLNESGLSNSSMQLHNVSGLADEDVNVGGNELPVSSYPPTVRENHTVSGLAEEDVNVGGDELPVSSNPPVERENHTGSGSGSGRSDNELDVAKVSDPAKHSEELSDPRADLEEETAVGNLVEGPKDSVGGSDQSEQNSRLNHDSVEVDRLQDGESAPSERQVSPDKLYRAALLNRFADTILKAKEKALNQDEKGDPEQLRREREELELQKKKEKARLQIEAKAAEEARRRAEAEAAAEAKRKRELEREEARQALLKMEKTVEMNENSQFLKDLEMLRGVPTEQMAPSPIDETMVDDGFGSFKFGGSNPLEQLGLYMKMDDDEEEGEPPGTTCINPDVVNDDVEEGEID